MKVRSVTSTLCFDRGRLDSQYYLSPGVAARDRITAARERGMATGQLDKGAIPGQCWMPSRLKQVQAAPGEDAVPYLRPYDVFECLPTPAAWLSGRRTEAIDDYRVDPGTILQTRSGRNLGPLTVADKYISGFVLSDDMLRVTVDDDEWRAYLYAFFSSPTGQAILRQRMSGSVIDHLTVEDLEALTIPILAGESWHRVVEVTTSALTLLEGARLELDAVLAEMRDRYPPPARMLGRRPGPA